VRFGWVRRRLEDRGLVLLAGIRRSELRGGARRRHSAMAALLARSPVL